LGFSPNVRIARYGNAGNSGQFSLIVEYDEKLSPTLTKGSIDPDSALKIWLTYKYESKFFILPTAVAKDPALKEMVKSSVDIDDEDAIALLFGHRLEQMTVLNDYIEDEGVLKFIIPKIREKLGTELNFSRPELEEEEKLQINDEETATPIGTPVTDKPNFFTPASSVDEKKRFREEVINDLSHDPQLLANFISNIPDDQLESLTKKAKHSPPTSPTAIKSH
jgi:hypothetical protein